MLFNAFKRSHLLWVMIILGLMAGMTMPVPAARADWNQLGDQSQIEISNPMPNAQPLDGEINGVRSLYKFGSSIGTYTEITEGTLHNSGEYLYNRNYNNVNIGFTFEFNEINFTQVSINTNGFVRFGERSYTDMCSYDAISNPDAEICSNLVSPHSDHQQGNIHAELRSQLLGTAPERIFVIQWKDFRHFGELSRLYYQVRLYEGTNIVEFVYGTFQINDFTRHPQVGIKGTGNFDYESRTTTTDWSNSDRSDDNYDTMLLTPTVYPATGLTYTWTPTPPTANFTTSKINLAPVSLNGSPISQVISITNTGRLASMGTFMTTPIPEGMFYIPDSLACNNGICSYDEDNNRITWSGGVRQNTTVEVSFEVQPDEVLCNSVVFSSASITDGEAEPERVDLNANTYLVADIPLLFSGFEEKGFPPPGWSMSYFHMRYPWLKVSSGRPVYGGEYATCFTCAFNRYYVSTRLETSTFSLPADKPYQLVFQMYHDLVRPEYNDGIRIEISLDDGANWFSTGIHFWRYYPSYDEPGWDLHKVDLSEYSGESTVKLGFAGLFMTGGNIYLDNVAVAQMNYPCPCSISSSAGNACQGETSSQTLSVSCATSQIVDLSLTGHNWDAVLEPAVVDVPAGGSLDVTVSVQVPKQAELMEGDSLVVTAIPRNLPGGMVQSTVQTSYLGISGDWTIMSPLPEGRMNAAETATGDHVFVIGGMSTSDELSTVTTNYRYTIASDAWEEMSPAPVNLSGVQAGVVDGRIYIPGALTETWDGNTYVYDTGMDAWSTIPAGDHFIGARNYSVAVDAQSGRIYRLGGLVDDGAGGSIPTNRVWVLDVAAQTWTELAPMQTARTDFVAGWLDGKLAAAGGTNELGLVNNPSMEIFDGTEWNYAEPLPTNDEYTGWSFQAGGVARDALFLFGGIRDSTLSSVNHTGMYVPGLNSWLTSPALPALNQARASLGGGASRSALWATGGVDSDGSTLYDTHERLLVCREPVSIVWMPLITR